MNLNEYENLQPHVVLDGITFLTPNTHCAWRVDTLYKKEPDTIAWINKMHRGDVLFDIGANMGQYSLYAAKRGIRVHAFEPESQNFALLCRNIAINKMGDLITPWPIALTNVRHRLDTFHVTTLTAGGSCNSFGESVDYHLQPKQFAFKQGCFGTDIDSFVQEYDCPDHIKIDVDGFEHLVLDGARGTLRRTKSVLVETNTHLPEHNAIAELMNGFALLPDIATADEARRKDGPFAGIGNVIYYRTGV